MAKVTKITHTRIECCLYVVKVQKEYEGSTMTFRGSRIKQSLDDPWFLLLTLKEFFHLLLRDSCKLGEYLSAALCHHIGGALLVVPYYLPIIKRVTFPHQSGIRALWFERKCIVLFLLLRSQNLCLMKNETLSINSLKFKEGTSLSDHLNEFQGIIDQMSGMGIKFEDEILGLLLLNSLPESWETFK
ncbi:hypothetical protein CR513_18200, partial [Mucuna pruriens]